MRTLDEQIEINASAEETWQRLHQVEEYPRFIGGVLRATTGSGNRARLEVRAGGSERTFDAELTDRGQERTLNWRTTAEPALKGSCALYPVDAEHTKLEVQIEYDPDTVRDAFGGPRGFAQSNLIAQAVRADLEQFKHVVEEQR